MRHGGQGSACSGRLLYGSGPVGGRARVTVHGSARLAERRPQWVVRVCLGTLARQRGARFPVGAWVGSQNSVSKISNPFHAVPSREP